jgi:hypothetical protein
MGLCLDGLPLSGRASASIGQWVTEMGSRRLAKRGVGPFERGRRAEWRGTGDTDLGLNCADSVRLGGQLPKSMQP